LLTGEVLFVVGSAGFVTFGVGAVTFVSFSLGLGVGEVLFAG
jgi:hypothetical protein